MPFTRKPCPLCHTKPEIMQSTVLWVAWCKTCDFDFAWTDRKGTVILWNFMVSEGEERARWLGELVKHRADLAAKKRRVR